MSTLNTSPKARAARRGREGGGTLKKLMQQNYPVRYLVPAYIMLLIFFFVPTVLNFIYAFTNWSAFSKTIEFNGFDNFIELFQSGTLLRDLRVTLVYAILVRFSRTRSV